MTEVMLDFEEFIQGKNDDIEDMAIRLLSALAFNKRYPYDSIILSDWDTETVGQLVDYAENLIIKKGYGVCRPFYEGDEEIPCYLSEECKRTDCLFKNFKEEYYEEKNT